MEYMSCIYFFIHPKIKSYVINSYEFRPRFTLVLQQI